MKHHQLLHHWNYSEALTMITNTTNNNVSEKWDDPIVAEVRKNREDYYRAFNYDREAIFADIREGEKLHKEMGFKFVSIPEKHNQKKR